MRRGAGGLAGGAEGFEKEGWAELYIRVSEVDKNPSILQPFVVSLMVIRGKVTEGFGFSTLQHCSALHGLGEAGWGSGRRCFRPGMSSAPSRRSSPSGPGPRLKGLKGLKINPSATFSLIIIGVERLAEGLKGFPDLVFPYIFCLFFCQFYALHYLCFAKVGCTSAIQKKIFLAFLFVLPSVCTTFALPNKHLLLSQLK